MKVELEWHLASRKLPDPGKRLFFHTGKKPAGAHDHPSYERGEFHAGYFGARVFVTELPVGTMVFRSDRSDVTAAAEEYLPDAVWCWAYPPEVPT